MQRRTIPYQIEIISVIQTKKTKLIYIQRLVLFKNLKNVVDFIILLY
jgi:hypothetical protein